MNDPDDFGFGNIGPDTLEMENQQDQELEQESNTSTQQSTAATIHQLATMNEIWTTLALVMLAPTHWKQNINKNKNKNRIQAHNKILLQPLLRRRDEGTQYRRNFVICTRSDDNRRMDNHRERHAVV